MGLRKCPAPVEKVAEGRLGLGVGGCQGQGSIASSGPACPSHNLQLPTGVVKPAKPVRCQGQSPDQQEQVRQQTAGAWDRKDREAPPNLPAQPQGLSQPGVRLVLTSPLSFLTLEC